MDTSDFPHRFWEELIWTQDKKKMKEKDSPEIQGCCRLRIRQMWFPL
jgi:hypothetical protein